MRLPSKDDVIAGGPSGVYGPLPQLGYVPHVIVAKILPIGDLSLVGRFGSLLAGLAAVLAAYFLGREVFSSRTCALALPVMLLFHPQLVFVNSYSNSDTTTCALCSVLLLLFVRAIKGGLSVRMSLLIGFLLGWTALTKYSGVAIFPPAILALILSVFIHRYTMQQSLKHLLIVGGTFALTCGWWFLRSFREFDGDVLGTKTMRTLWAKTYNKPLEYKIPLSHVIKDQVFWSTIHDSYWGLFGYVSRFLHPAIYYTYLGFLGTAIIGGIKQFLQSSVRANKFFHKDLLADRQKLVSPAIWMTFGLCVATNISAMVAGAAMNLGGAQGRYLFPSEIAIMALLIAGLSKFGKVGEYLVLALVIFNVLVCFGAFFMLMHTPGYGFTTKLY
ncbi:MAG TPA: glycosyltransferase family 39 protein [Drouetiella sp.]